MTAGVVFVITLRDGQEGMDPSGSPRRLDSNDPWQASTIDAVAVPDPSSKIPAVWEDCAGVSMVLEQVSLRFTLLEEKPPEGCMWSG